MTSIILMIIGEVFFFLKSLITTNLAEREKTNNSKTTEIVEEIIYKYRERAEKAHEKIQKLLNISENCIHILKIYLLKDKVQLYLLRNNLYRILNKSVLDLKVRKLVKLEILKAPEETYSDFVKLYNDLKEELYRLSRKEHNNSNYPLN